MASSKWGHHAGECNFIKEGVIMWEKIIGFRHNQVGKGER